MAHQDTSQPSLHTYIHTVMYIDSMKGRGLSPACIHTCIIESMERRGEWSLYYCEANPNPSLIPRLSSTHVNGTGAKVNESHPKGREPGYEAT